jgi:hypothetical protein
MFVILNGFLFFNKSFFIKIYKRFIFFSVSRHFFKKYFKNFIDKKLFFNFCYLLVPYKFSLFLYFYLVIL